MGVGWDGAEAGGLGRRDDAREPSHACAGRGGGGVEVCEQLEIRYGIATKARALAEAAAAAWVARSTAARVAAAAAAVTAIRKIGKNKRRPQ